VLLSQAALLLCSITARASVVNLAPGLEISLPSALAIEIIEPQEQHNGPVIVGELGGMPGYFMAATRVTMWERDPALWKRLETEIRKQSKSGDFLLRIDDSFQTSLHNIVNFKAYEYESGEQKHTQVYFLLRDDRNIYWITLTTAKGVDINLAIPIAQSLISRARFIDEQHKPLESQNNNSPF
jgi:hypothetical protein